MRNVVIAGYARSPFTFAEKSALKKVRPDELAARVVESPIRKTGVNADDIEDLILGCAFPEAERGLNVARLARVWGARHCGGGRRCTPTCSSTRY